MSLTTEELNLLIYHYLQESGFTHSAFVFHQETISQYNIKNVEIPIGALVGVVQKGIQYMELEAHVSELGEETKCNAPFNILGDHHCELTAPVQEEEEIDPEPPKKQIKLSEPTEPILPVEEPEKEEPTNKIFQKEVETPTEAITPIQRVPETNNVELEPEIATVIKQEKELKEKDPRDKDFKVFREEDATILLGHESEVYICAWNPIFPSHIATGSNDGAGRVWRLPCTSKSDKVLSSFLGHNSSNESRDVASIDWHPKGTILVIGTYDAYIRQYTHSGWLRFEMLGHESPVLSVKYNTRGNLILSGSMDLSARIWCTSEGKELQKIEWHSGPVVSVDWKDEEMFSTCSTDCLIYTGRYQDNNPIIIFDEHTASVNAIKWDPTGKYLASCSDDMNIKLWSLDQKSSLFTLKRHKESISSIIWSPNPIGPNKTHLLASASDDKTVCLWDVSSGKLLYEFAEHSVRITSIAFSPDSKYLASSAFDSSIHIFSTEDGKLFKSYFRPGEIFDLKWSPSGESLAACYSDSSVALFDIAK